MDERKVIWVTEGFGSLYRRLCTPYDVGEGVECHQSKELKGIRRRIKISDSPPHVLNIVDSKWRLIH